MAQPKHPKITVQLTGQDSNTFMLVSRTRTAMKRAGLPEGQLKEFFEEALSGDADHALETITAWVSVA